MTSWAAADSAPVALPFEGVGVSVEAGTAARGGWRERKAATASIVAELVEQAREGDKDAFGRIYELRFDHVYRFVVASLRDTGRTEDVVAQTFLTAWRKLDTLRDPERFDSWLFQIAYRLLVDDVRAAKARPTGTPLDNELELADESTLSSPGAMVGLQDDCRDLHAALAELPEDQRMVLVLRFLRELPHAEVARAMGRREEAVRALQYRALKRLRKILGDRDATDR